MTTSTRSPVRTVLAVGAAATAAALVVALIGLVVDPRVIAESPAWAKPAKFAFSITLYLLTLRWILSFVSGHARLLLVIGVGVVVALVAEIVLVDVQVLRGTTSHFNESTDVNALIFYAMGGIVSNVLIATIAAGVVALGARGFDAGLAAGLRWGIGVCVLGMIAAITMITNREWSESGGHTVGAVDGGPGMPLTGWSLLHGDLRVGHFVGLHALQLLPLLAWALARWTPLGAATRTRLLHIAGATYALTVVSLTLQAMRGQSIVRPDGETLVAATALATVAIVTVLIVLLRDRRAVTTKAGV
jgi:hypothetical protein